MCVRLCVCVWCRDIMMHVLQALELQQAVNTKKAKLQELMQIDRLVDQLVAVSTDTQTTH